MGWEVMITMGIREVILFFKWRFLTAKESVVNFFKKPFRKEEKFRFTYIILFLILTGTSYLFIKTQNLIFLILLFISMIFYYELEKFKKGDWRAYFRKKVYGRYTKIMKKQKEGRDFLREKFGD